MAKLYLLVLLGVLLPLACESGKLDANYGKWSKLSASKCELPAGKTCIPGTIMKGSKTRTRTCTGKDCDSAKMSKKRNCNVRCKKVKFDKLSKWVQDGECTRPKTGPCANQKTCCDERKGEWIIRRTCQGNNCDPSKALVKVGRSCFIRCRDIKSCDMPEVPNASSTCSKKGLSVGKSCSFTCNDNFEMNGDATVFCKDENNDFIGELTELPTCEKKVTGETCWEEGELYYGTADTTASGKKCDPWSNAHGGWHMYDDNGDYDSDVYDAFWEDIDNSEDFYVPPPAGSYCRNYKRDPNGPYCFIGAVDLESGEIQREILKGNILTKQPHFEYCNIPKCQDKTPVWGDWEAGECSASCGAGTVKSTRTCSVEGKCEGDAEKTEECNKGECATWGDWEEGDCSASCGAGTVKSTRKCSGLGDCDGVAEKSAACNKGACATWGEWEEGDCSASCGAGTVKSTRQCSGLGDCDGVAEKSAACNKVACVTPCAPPTIANGFSNCDRSPSIGVGAGCTASCNDGFEMKGDAAITCGNSNNDGKGDFVLPTCEKKEVAHGGILYEGSEYVFLPEKQNVDLQGAKDACAELGGYKLARVKTTGAMQAIFDYAIPLYPLSDWYRTNNYGLYLYTDGTFQPTGATQPNPIQWSDGTETQYNMEWWLPISVVGTHRHAALYISHEHGAKWTNIWDYMANLSFPLCEKRD